MGMPHKLDSSSNDLSAHDEGVSQPVQEAPMPANQEQAMDDFMVDWFGFDIVDDMSSNPHDEGPNADDPRHQHTAQGQRQWQEAEAHAQTHIFQGVRLSRLATILGLLNIQAKHKANNTMLSDIFQYCHSLLLPKENVLPGSWKEAKNILSSIGMEYQIVHACVNDCMLFHGNNAHLTECSTCEEARYDPHMLIEKVPEKSVRWFPLFLACCTCIDVQTWPS
jgi:hypothetical protein